MSNRLRLIRIISIALLSAGFTYLAYYLAIKQSEKYTITSFKIENEQTGILINNCDRLTKKINTAQDILVPEMPLILSQGIDYLLANNLFSINDKFGKQCYLSINPTDFAVTFKIDLSSSKIQEILSKDLAVSSSEHAQGITINGKNYWVANYNKFTTISSAPIIIKKQSNDVHYGNTDYLVFNSADNSTTSHIIVDNYHHILQEDSAQSGPLGSNVWYKNYMQHVPSSFNELEFYGSSRWITDYRHFFLNPDEASMHWADGGIVLIKKDSFYVMIAPQSLEQDLKLLLEEQAYNSLNDTNQIAFFNIGPFEIMPFQTKFNWTEALNNGYSDFGYYTAVENYNVVSNSIPAMRWYLSELQLGNLFFKNSALNDLSLNAIPNRLHYLSLKKNSEEKIEIVSKSWRNNVCLSTHTLINNNNVQKDNVLLILDFEVGINPTHIQAFKKSDTSFVLLSNETQVALYSELGREMWRLNLTSNLSGPPQIIDIDNNGSSEIVLFQGTQFDIINHSGKSISGFPKNLTNGISKGGLAVNYDNSFDYRFLVSSGNHVTSYNEAGRAVEGWAFAGMTAPLKGKISYFIAQDKDLIAFKDGNNNQYVLNRRGESRLNKNIVVNLPNESDFVVGKYEVSSLRKLGYKNNVIQNYYLLDGHVDSIKLDENVFALNARWVFNNNQPLLLVEEKERVIIFDEFGYVKSSVLKPEGEAKLVDVLVKQGFSYVFADNSQNTVYLLNEYGKMIFPVPLKASNVFLIKDNLFYSFFGTKIKIYQLE